MLAKQQLAFDKFTKLKIGALFMKMGTGKTRVALELVKYNNVDLLVYVCPFSVKDTIKNEIIKWGVNCNYVIVGYETIQASDKEYISLLNLLDNKNSFIIADESIFIKNEDTTRFKRLCELRKKCKYALILNGTPLTKNEWDLYNQMYFLSELIINMNRQDFLETFFTKVVYKKLHMAEKSFYKFSEINANYLYKMIKPYIFEADLSFEKMEIESTIFVDYVSDEYGLEKNERLKEYKRKERSCEIMQMLTNLNVISSCYNKKLDVVAEYIKDKKLICYCNFIKEVEYLSKKINCFIITGEIKNRSKILKDFENSNIPLVMTYGVGSYSLNLQFCNEIVYSSINFDYGLIEQSKYRIKRIGQYSNIKYTYILTNLGITKLILDNLKKKENLEKLIKEKIKNGGIEEWIKCL